MRKLLDAARAERHRRVAGKDGGPGNFIIADHPMSEEEKLRGTRISETAGRPIYYMSDHPMSDEEWERAYCR